jgi:hypothetical protein
VIVELALFGLVVPFILMVVSSRIIRALGGNSVAVYAIQILLMTAYAGVMFFTISVWVAAFAFFVPHLVRIFVVLLAQRVAGKVRDGEWGEPAMWVYELHEAEDEEFIRAVNALSDEERRDIGIIAESKDDLRERVVERASDE